MTRARALRVGGWAAVVGLAIVVGLLLGALLIIVAFPAFERSGVTAVVPRPAPGPTSTLVRPRARTWSWARPWSPATAQCAGCHTTGAGAIGLDTIPVMAHPIEGWGRCASCHAPARLVDTAPGHAGIHATECTICHKPGDLPAPLSRPHRDDQNVACLSCHGKTAPLPTDMTHRKETTCWLCHRLPTIEPPVPAHATAPGEADCRTCHTAGGARRCPPDRPRRAPRHALPVLPRGHSRHDDAEQSARLQVWPAPSGSPDPRGPGRGSSSDTAYRAPRFSSWSRSSEITEVMGDLVVDGVGDGGRQAFRRPTCRTSGRGRSSILLGVGAASADRRVRGTPW